MATHDYVISNQSFPSTRTDINNVLAAIVSNNSSATAPATTFANMIWYDSANNKLYIRNEDNDAWIELFVLDQTGDHLEKIGDTITLDGTGNMSLAGDLTVDTDTLFVDASASAVGIGTTTVTDAGVTIINSVTRAGSWDAKLALQSTGANDFPALLFTNSNTTQYGGIVGTTDTSGNDGNNQTAQIQLLHTSDGGNLAFRTNGNIGTTSTTERMRIDQNGNVGIGTTSPVRQFHIHESSGGSNSYIHMTSAATGTTTTDGLSILVTGSSGQAIINQREAQPLAFYTSNTERMRIFDDGRVGFGTTETVPTDGGTVIYGSLGLFYISRGGTNSVTTIRFSRDGSTVGSIGTTGTATSYNTSSDYRLKENVTGITDGITRLKQLNPSRFNFISDADRTVDGFIAHEAATVVPEAVTGSHNGVETWTQDEIDAGDAPANTSAGDNKLDDDGNTIPDYQGIDQSKLVPLLTAALQEAVAKIEALETRVAALEA